MLANSSILGDFAYLLKPSMKICSRHQQHIHAQRTNSQRNFRPQSPLLRTISWSFGLHFRALDRPIHHIHSPLLLVPSGSVDHMQYLLKQEHASQHQQEHMATDIMSTLPLPTNGFARDAPNELALITYFRFPRLRQLQEVALPSGKYKASIDNRRSEEPLRHKDPPDRNDPPSQRSPYAICCNGEGVCWPCQGMREQEEEIAECDPCPAALDEELVEDVALRREVGRRGVGEM